MPRVTMPLPHMNTPTVPATVTLTIREMPALDGPGNGEVEAAQGVAQDAGAWSLWQNLEGAFISAPAVAAWGDQQSDLFGISTDSQLYHKRWDGSAWSLWESLEGTCIYAPAAVARGANLVDVFAIGLDKQVYRKWWDGESWQGWEEIGGTCFHGLAATSWGPDRIDLFTVGANSCIYHNSWDGEGWLGWRPFLLKEQMTWEKNSTSIAAPAAVATAPGRIDLFALGIDNHVYHAWGDGEEWQGWENVGGPAVHGMAVTTAGPQRLDLFIIGTDIQGVDNHMYHRAMMGSTWSNWENLGGACISAPAAVARGAGRLDAFVVGTRSALFQKSWTDENTDPGVQGEDNDDDMEAEDSTGVTELLAAFYNRLTYYLGFTSQTTPAFNSDQYNVKPDPTVTDFANNPFDYYAKIMDRRRDDHNNPNFPFPELKGTLDNMLLHIEDIQQRAQSGPADPPDQENFRCQVHANVSKRLKQELQGPTLDNLKKDILALKGLNCPYQKSLLLIAKFIKVVDYITFRAKSQPEMESYDLKWKDVKPGRGKEWEDLSRQVTDRRNKKFATKRWSFNTTFPLYHIEITLEDIYNEAYNSNYDSQQVNVGGTGIYRFENLYRPDSTMNERKKDRFLWLVENPDILLFPSYEPLNEEFFCKIRCVPIFMLGMLNIEYLNADNDRQSPAVFFEHDCFHVIGLDSSDGYEKGKQQLATLRKGVEDWKLQGYSEADVSRFWSQNWQQLQQKIQSMKSHYLQDAVYKVLFMLLHEPMEGDAVVAVPEINSLQNRLSEKLILRLRARIEKGEFGDVDPMVTTWLPLAAEWIKKNVNERLLFQQPVKFINL